jgi:hypothetical protein
MEIGSQQKVSLARLYWGAPSCAQPTGKLDVLLLDGDALGVDGAKVRVVEQIDQEGFGGLLERLDGLALPSGGPCLGGDGLRDFADLGGR